MNLFTASDMTQQTPTLSCLYVFSIEFSLQLKTHHSQQGPDRFIVNHSIVKGRALCCCLSSQRMQIIRRHCNWQLPVAALKVFHLPQCFVKHERVYRAPLPARVRWNPMKVKRRRQANSALRTHCVYAMCASGARFNFINRKTFLAPKSEGVGPRKGVVITVFSAVTFWLRSYYEVLEESAHASCWRVPASRFPLIFSLADAACAPTRGFQHFCVK